MTDSADPTPLPDGWEQRLLAEANLERSFAELRGVKHFWAESWRGRRRALPTAVPVVPDPEVPEKAQRRQYSVEYKLGILAEADACVKPGELAELLGREGLYSSHLVAWRRQGHVSMGAVGKPWAVLG